jgi:thiol-disulfide isomerase/thioredoxin
MSQSTSVSTRSTWTGRLPVVLFLIVASWFYFRTVSYTAPSHVQWSSVPLEDLDGSPLPPQTIQGKPVLLNFWAPWCGPCRAELPWLERLQKQHPELVVIGLEDDPDDFQNATAVAARAGISYPLVRTSKSLRSTFGHVVELPTTLYISRSGRVLHTISGVIPESLMMRYAMEAESAP